MNANLEQKIKFKNKVYKTTSVNKQFPVLYKYALENHSTPTCNAVNVNIHEIIIKKVVNKHRDTRY